MKKSLEKALKGVNKNHSKKIAQIVLEQETSVTSVILMLNQIYGQNDKAGREKVASKIRMLKLKEREAAILATRTGR